MKRRIAVIDAETDPFRKGRIPQPFLWGFYDGEQYREFNKTASLAAFIAEQDCICYAHNGGKFDFHYLLDALEGFDELTIINGRIARCYIGLAELRDSWCIINEPLRSYKKDDFDYSLMEAGARDKRANRELICKYLRNDCVYLWEMVTAFVTRFGPELTQASAAMKQWIKISNDPPEPTDEGFYKEFVPYYYGGRVECFRSGIIKTDFHVYDINSAYPYAMMHKHPYSNNFERIEGHVCNADFVRVRCIARGCFPYRSDGRAVAGSDGSEDVSGSGLMAGLHFPRDDVPREYLVTGWEYDAAVDTKSIQDAEVLESIRFVRHRDFSEYVTMFWAERQAAKASGDILTALFCKLMMNSFYGKFAANPENYKNFMILPMDKAAELTGEGTTWTWAGELGPWALAERPLDEYVRRYYNVAISASITGFVRAMLWRAIHSSKGVLYCDTDSIAVARKGDSVALGNGLGFWKDEGSYDRAGIAGKKLYIFRGKPNCDRVRGYKSASKGARLSHKQLWQVAAGEAVNYSPEVPTYSVLQEPHFVKRRIINTAGRK